MSFSALRGTTFTRVLAGLAFTSINSPGRNGFGTPFFAFWAGFFTVLIFINPGTVQCPDGAALEMPRDHRFKGSEHGVDGSFGQAGLIGDVREDLSFGHRLLQVLHFCQHVLLWVVWIQVHDRLGIIPGGVKVRPRRWLHRSV